MFSEEHKNKCNELSRKIIGCAIEVHKVLGPGLLESTYETCLCYELSKLGLKFERQPLLPLCYKEMTVDDAFRLDVNVENLVIIENKAITEVPDIDRARVKTYLKLTNQWLALLLNFNVTLMKDGIERIVWG